MSYRLEHVCTECFNTVDRHVGMCDCGGEHFPPLCCPGCDCKSHEEAHPPKDWVAQQLEDPGVKRVFDAEWAKREAERRKVKP